VYGCAQGFSLYSVVIFGCSFGIFLHFKPSNCSVELICVEGRCKVLPEWVAFFQGRRKVCKHFADHVESEFNQDLLFYFRNGLSSKTISYSSWSAGNYGAKSNGILSFHGSNRTIGFRAKDKLVFFASGKQDVTYARRYYNSMARCFDSFSSRTKSSRRAGTNDSTFSEQSLVTVFIFV